MMVFPNFIPAAQDPMANFGTSGVKTKYTGVEDNTFGFKRDRLLWHRPS
ncbi:hypothetical protein M758_9G037700 [Ceratodon purpureus]|nr:hypothetical protein M758_9G037700 [Ceratodon purpureus]